MKAIAPADIIPHQEYERQREAFRANIIVLKQRRRMSPSCTPLAMWR